MSTVADDLGSKTNIEASVEQIQGQYQKVYRIFGEMAHNNYTYASASFHPDLSTLDAMKKMERFSFTALGDGNTYMAMIATTDTVESGYNNYLKMFTIKNAETITLTFNYNELAQQRDHYGKIVPFINDNILNFGIAIYSQGEFDLRIWDIRFY